MKGNMVILGISSMVGLGLLGGGIYSGWHTQKFLQTAISVDGLVTDNIKRESYSRYGYAGITRTYYPRVSFRTKEGRSSVYISKHGSRSPSYRRFQTVPIVYDPRQPHHVAIRSFTELWLVSTFLLGMGIVFCGPGIVFLWRRAKRWKERLAARKRASHSGAAPMRGTQG
jgi:hypothetical protein